MEKGFKNKIELLQKRRNKKNWTEIVLWLYLLGYGLFSYAFLTRYPFVHSDESWLAGLSRTMLENKSLSVTESFFDARQRYPHAIKSLFHLLQMAFIEVFGYSIESVRLLSLIAGLLFLAVFYFLIKKVTKREKLALAITVLFSLDTEFIYASHFARQEIILGVSLIAGLFLLLDLFLEGSFKKKETRLRNVVLAAIITGASIGLHPNSFLLACSFGSILLFLFITEEKKNGKLFGIYIGITGLFALFFVAVSYSFDGQFLTHYFANGALEFDVDASLTTKAGELWGFFQRLFERFSGTYYVTELRFSLLLFAFLVVFLGIYALVMKEMQLGAVLFGVLGLLGGMIIIGRYNQTSVFFFFPFGYLLFAMLLSMLEKFGRRFFFVGVLVITIGISIGEITPWLEKTSYESYLSKLQELVPRNAKTIANLNTEFYFDEGCLRDYRNLPYALEQGGLKAYIEKNEIEYVVYSTELDYLYEHRPYFNVIYGNVMFVAELRDFCEKNCEKVGEFVNTEYGSRVIGIMGQEEYSKVMIYKVN